MVHSLISCLDFVADEVAFFYAVTSGFVHHTSVGFKP